MIVAAHQPQYIPYLGYFHKIAASDLFILLDDVQYKKREFQNRNRIRTAKGSMWLTVPVETRGKYAQLISEVRLSEDPSWRHSHWESLRQCYGRAPEFSKHAPFFESLYGRPWDRLGPLSEEIIAYVCRAFGIEVPFSKASEFAVKTTSTRRLIDLCRAAGADAYLSGAGGKDYLQEDLFQTAGIALTYQAFEHPAYAQCFPGFERNLSALDYLFNVPPKEAGEFFRAARRHG